MSIKNKIFKSFVQGSYSKVLEVENKEEVYYHKNKLAVIVNDEEIGARIYDVVKSLKDCTEIICTPHTHFNIYKYISDDNNRIQMFCVRFTFETGLQDLSEIEKLQELVSFVDSMQNNGYILDNSKFDNKSCDCISALLSFFTINNGETSISNDSLIKYIHYKLSKGEDFDEFYRGIFDKGLASISEFSYNLPVIKMCYEYFKTGTFEGNIYDILDVLQEEYLERENLKVDNFTHQYSHLLFDKNNFVTNNSVIKETDDYTVYDENIKLYHNISPDFEKFLETIKYYKSEIVEQISGAIIDLNEEIVGYKFWTPDAKKVTKLKTEFKNQYEIFEFIASLLNYLFKMKFYLSEEQNDFNIEESIVFNPITDSFKFTEISELFNLLTCDENKLKNQITFIFLKIYLTYIKNKYGEMSDEEQFFSKKEIRYLHPVLAKEFINYSFGKEVDIETATTELLDFRKFNHFDNECMYATIFEYNPAEVPFVFDYEAERKYGIKLKKGMDTTLSDGTRLVMFGKKRRISKIKEQEDSVRREISRCFSNTFEDEHVKIVGISEIIYSKTINPDGMYDAVGYVTTPSKGRVLTTEILYSNFSNKDFLKIVGYLLCKFEHYNITLDSIIMDDDFVFYINIQDENFQIRPRRIVSISSSYIDWLIEYLTNTKGCSPNKFVDYFETIPYFSPGEKYISFAESLDSYCEEHDIYFDSSKNMCPICSKTKYFISDKELSNARKVFEDEFATHYRIHSGYNLKVYKSSCENLSLLENNIDEIIARSNSKFGKLLLYQDCFIPYKKAINAKKEFIGYIYNTVNFDECLDINDLQSLNNLPRVKSLIRLIEQVTKLVMQDLRFVNNPFNHVFLIKNHKKQVQILNIEFAVIKKNADDNYKWLYNYVCDVINSDEFIDINIPNSTVKNGLRIFKKSTGQTIYELGEIKHKLIVLANKMTKYCSVHKMYYSNEYLFCPKCVDNPKIMNTETVDKSEITSLKEFNEGGESFIYSYDANSVVKVFKEKNLNIDLKHRIFISLSNKQEILEKVNKDSKIKYKFIIPKKLLIDRQSNNIFAYTMDKVEGTSISSLRDKGVVEKLGLTKKDVLEILITVGEGIEYLHKNNMYIGDLNGRNILFDSNKIVYFLDFDGMGMDDIAPEFCTDTYIDPVSKKNNNITMKDDWYSFAIQAFYYLTFTHPFNGIYSVRENNGKKVMLEITDKMERKISLLGNHGMKPPAIAIPWDWMTKKLQTAFYTIFEGDNRESIVPYLIEQYEQLYKSTFSSTSGNDDVSNSDSLNTVYTDEHIRINQKFLAATLNPFKDDVIYVINPYSAVCSNGNETYITILDEVDKQEVLGRIRFHDCINIKNILLSENKELAFVVYSDHIKVFNISMDNAIYSESISEPENVVVNGNTLYFTDNSEGENLILIRDFSSTEVVKKEKIKLLTNLQTKRFYAKSNSKFVIVKRASETTDEVYCNSEKLCDINYSSENSGYNIIYDSISKFWLVINSEGSGIVINSRDGSYDQIHIRDSIGINDFNIENITFNKGNIYIPSQDCLYIINITNQFNTKKMECHEIMTSDSKVYNITNEGFSVMANNTLYEVRKG